MQPIRLAVRALGAAALTALVATSLPNLTATARAAAPASVTANAPAIDITNLDPTCKACDDFYQFATGGWSKKAALPAGRARWGGFDELAARNRDVLHGILEDAAKATDAPAGSDTQKLGAYFRACMDTGAIEKAGTTPIAPLLDTIASAHDLPSLVTTIAALQRNGVEAGLALRSRPDTKDSTKQIASMGLGGLGLPDRDYYFNEGERSAAIRAAYHEYVATQLASLGDDPAKAQTEATAVIALETALATATPKRADLRDPYKTYNPMPVDQLTALAPHIPWKAYFAAYAAPAFGTIDLSVPSFVTAYDAQLAGTPLDVWKSYLRFHVADAYANTLPKRFEDASFTFRSGVLLGVKEQLPRWQRCTTSTDAALRDVLGKAYVTAAFPPSAKARAQALVDNLQRTLHDDIGTLAWMSPQTKTRAVEKLAAFTKKIGYPDTWEDYSTLQVAPNAPFASNTLAVRRWNDARTIARIGTPTNRARWGMTPPTVNAYYSPSNNEIVFPAGILGPPFFNATADDAVNYGAIGAVIGHEMTHGFDDQGRQFDAQGNLRDWWTAGDAAAFKTKAQCIVDEFDAFEPAPGAHENGRLVQGEAIADLGGLTIAHKAFERTAQAKAHKNIDGYTPEQRFFLAYAQVWRSIATEGYIRQVAATNEHPWDKYRVIGTLSNMPEFQSAFKCAATDKMVRKDRCQIW
ncbi:MAG: putative endopeptidase [Candidatus Eremiobacteraeota bacterium]|jgi:putative endopeptidase|nr:putative endopeptidase [Candidatus Eremiobacteraeota bacterium]